MYFKLNILSTLILKTLAFAAPMLYPDLPDIKMKDTSLNVPVWSIILTTTTCVNTNSNPSIVGVKMVDDTSGSYIYPPIWNDVNVATIQDINVNNIANIQYINLNNSGVKDWEVCGVSLQINNVLVYEDMNQFKVGAGAQYSLPLETLQADPNWTKSTAICNPPSGFSVQDMKQLVIGKLGSFMISGKNGLTWANNTMNWVLLSSNGNTHTNNQLQYLYDGQEANTQLNFDVAVACDNNQLSVSIINVSGQITEGSLDVSMISEANAALSSAIAQIESSYSFGAAICPTLSTNADGSLNIAWPFGFGNMGALCW